MDIDDLLSDRSERHEFGEQFYVLLVNNAVQKMRKWVTNTISLYKLTNVLLLFICFKLVLSL